MFYRRPTDISTVSNNSQRPLTAIPKSNTRASVFLQSGIPTSTDTTSTNVVDTTTTITSTYVDPYEMLFANVDTSNFNKNNKNIFDDDDGNDDVVMDMMMATSSSARYMPQLYYNIMTLILIPIVGIRSC